MMIVKLRGQYIYRGNAAKIPVHNLISDDLFTRSEIIADFLDGELIIEGYEAADHAARVQLISSETFTGHIIAQEDLAAYLKYKTAQKAHDQFDVVMREINYLKKELERQTGLFQNVLREMLSIKNILQRPGYVTLKEVASIFPQFKTGTIRNKLSQVRWQDEHGKWHSELKIDEFRLRFKKLGKKWISERFEYETEKTKINDYDFHKKIKGGNHAI